MEAWKKGLKGVTIYREGSRTGVLINKKEFNQHDAPKRPKQLDAVWYSTTASKEDLQVIVGLYEEKPYEVFTIFEPPEIPDSTIGAVVKNAKGKYSFQSQDYKRSNIMREENSEHVAICRLVSTSLRHGADVKFIVEQLNKTPGELNSFARAIGRVLKKYIPDGETTTIRFEDCEGDCNIVFEEGCITCKTCGKSKC